MFLLLNLVLPVQALVLAHQHGHVCVVHHVVADGAHEGAPDGAHAARAQDDQVGALLCGHLDHHLASVTAHALHLAADPGALQLGPELLQEGFDALLLLGQH